MEVLHSAPSVDAFTPLSTHQSQTPDSFYEGPPVLHYRSERAKAVIPEHDLKASPALAGLTHTPRSTSHEAAVNGDADEQGPDVVLQDIDVWVTSERFILFSPSTLTGVSIPYPSISLHAIQRLHLPHTPPANPEAQGLFMQISTSDGFDDHDAGSTVSLTVVPSTPTPPPQPADPTTESSTASTPAPTQELFSAVTNCSNLHPDPVDQGSQDGDDQPMTFGSGDGGLPPPVPGSGGWITAENAGEFFDEEGNWRGGVLGPGAGVVRAREEEEDEEEGYGEGDAVEGEEVGEETKWRRTG